MSTTSWTSDDLIVIEAAIASGTLRVKYTDKEVEYRSLNEMLKIRDIIRGAIGDTSGRNKRIFSEHNRGY